MTAFFFVWFEELGVVDSVVLRDLVSSDSLGEDLPRSVWPSVHVNHAGFHWTTPSTSTPCVR